MVYFQKMRVERIKGEKSKTGIAHDAAAAFTVLNL